MLFRGYDEHCKQPSPASAEALAFATSSSYSRTNRSIFCSRVSGYRLLFFVGSSILVTFVFSAIALPISIPPTQAFPKVSSQIPYQIAASQEDIVVSGEQGKYVARILVNSSRENVWKILTGYTELSRFMPELVSSKMVENNGNQKVLDQDPNN